MGDPFTLVFSKKPLFSGVKTASTTEKNGSDSAYEPEALPEWVNRKASDGQAQMGNGIQGLPCVC